MSVIKRGKRWGARVYVGGGRFRWLGTFDTRREARAAEVKAQGERRRRRTEETCDCFGDRWVRDFPRPRASTNQHNDERIKAFTRDFAGIRLSDVDRVMARTWAQKNGSPRRLVVKGRPVQAALGARLRGVRRLRNLAQVAHSLIDAPPPSAQAAG